MMTSLMTPSWRSIQIIVWCVCVVEIAINAMLLYGSTSKRRYFMMPWLITTILQIVVNPYLSLISNFSCSLPFQLDLGLKYKLVFWIGSDREFGGPYGVLIFLSPSIIFRIFWIYIWKVVFSAYLDIKREEMVENNVDDEDQEMNEINE